MAAVRPRPGHDVFLRDVKTRVINGKTEDKEKCLNYIIPKSSHFVKTSNILIESQKTHTDINKNDKACTVFFYISKYWLKSQKDIIISYLYLFM